MGIFRRTDTETTLQDDWTAVVSRLPADTVWAISADCNYDAEHRGIQGLLFHTGQDFGFICWSSDFEIPRQPFAGATGHVMSERLVIENLGQRFSFGDAVSLRAMLPSPPHFSARVDSRRPFATISPLFNR